MISVTPFQIFGFDHLIVLIFIFTSVLFLPTLALPYSDKLKVRFGKLIAYLLIINELAKPIYYPIIWPDSYSLLNMLPLHLCHLSSFTISIFLLTKRMIFFEIAFFWGISGGLMANTQPDIRFGFPDMQFILFFFGHWLMWLGIAYSAIVFRKRPNFSSLRKVIPISLIMVLVIYSINLAINFFAPGNPANYWYLMELPAGANITNFMPSPPYQIPYYIFTGIIVFIIIYIPFALYDRNKKT
ncbi:MAG: hypothetical protein CBC38_06815 [Gammaproteobacteria bacterium TMED78]|nr:MAG: hypothetical protein CBC38_06815 [Gammaproteobacteria bacterium TMED78]|tara:strand:- start:3175 stop:3900 length:726 start_codon:yes stop_codon:yes gene_type:complete